MWLSNSNCYAYRFAQVGNRDNPTGRCGSSGKNATRLGCFILWSHHYTQVSTLTHVIENRKWCTHCMQYVLLNLVTFTHPLPVGKGRWCGKRSSIESSYYCSLSSIVWLCMIFSTLAACLRRRYRISHSPFPVFILLPMEQQPLMIPQPAIVSCQDPPISDRQTPPLSILYLPLSRPWRWLSLQSI